MPHVPAKEAKRILRAVSEAFESVKDTAPNHKYVLQYSLQVSKEVGKPEQAAGIPADIEKLKSGDFESGVVLVSQIEQPLIGVTDSEVMSYLDKIKGILNRFGDSEIVNLDVSIAEHSQINTTLREQTQTRYQMSKQLEATLVQSKETTAKAEVKKIQESAQALKRTGTK